MADAAPARVVHVLWRDALGWRVRLIVDRGESFPDNQRYTLDGVTVAWAEIERMAADLMKTKSEGKA